MYFCGIDIGSTAIKILLLDESERIVAYSISNTGGQFYKNSLHALNSLLAEHGMEGGDVSAIVSTGYGRKLFAEADGTVSEITANALGAMKLVEASGDIGTIINIGGQDSKAIVLDKNGSVKDFAMNDKCAAGTGRFIEMAARIMEVRLEELGAYHMRSQGVPVTINSTCTVFAESEIISLLAGGHEREEVIVGVHYSIARRISRLARRVGVAEPVFLDGGPALNRGLVAALEDELMTEIFVPNAPQITTALGAALMARNKFAKGHQNP